MRSHRRSETAEPRDIAAEIIRRANGPDGRPPYVIRLSEPPTPSERLQLIAARLSQTPVVIMPHPCETVAEWLERYAPQMPVAMTKPNAPHIPPLSKVEISYGEEG